MALKFSKNLNLKLKFLNAPLHDLCQFFTKLSYANQEMVDYNYPPIIHNFTVFYLCTNLQQQK